MSIFQKMREGMTRGFTSKRATRRGSILRVMAYFAVLVLVTLGFAVHTARAEMGQTALELGREMLPLSDVLREPHRINVNGERAWMSIAPTPYSVKDVLDRFETLCHKEGVKGTWTGAESLPPNAVDPGSFEFSVIRQEQKGEGVVLCFVKGEGTPDGMLARVTKFRQTGDFAALGKVRYAFASSTKSGTMVASLWTDGSLNIKKMAGIGVQGEPGTDNPDLPRPIDARRILSAGIDGTEYATRTYVSTASPADVTQKYEDEMIQRGWMRINPDPNNPDNMNRGYLKDGKAVLVGAKMRETKDASGNVPKQTMFVVAEIGGQTIAETVKQVSSKTVTTNEAP